MGSIEQLRNGTVSLAELEADIATACPADSSASIPLPDHVEYPDNVSGVGTLTAEAVVCDYEAAAKEIELMGAELIDAAKRCEAMTAEVDDVIAYMRDIAAAYREQAKKLFKRIEYCALVTQDVRKSCENVKRRMVESNNAE